MAERANETRQIGKGSFRRAGRKRAKLFRLFRDVAAGKPSLKLAARTCARRRRDVFPRQRRQLPADRFLFRALLEERLGAATVGLREGIEGDDETVAAAWVDARRTQRRRKRVDDVGEIVQGVL